MLVCTDFKYWLRNLFWDRAYPILKNIRIKTSRSVVFVWAGPTISQYLCYSRFLREFHISIHKHTLIHILRFLCHWLQRKPLVSDPGMHQGTCVTHVPWCMSGYLTSSVGETFPAFPAHGQPKILRIWQEVHRMTNIPHAMKYFSLYSLHINLYQPINHHPSVNG